MPSAKHGENNLHKNIPTHQLSTQNQVLSATTAETHHPKVPPPSGATPLKRARDGITAMSKLLGGHEEEFLGSQKEEPDSVQKDAVARNALDTEEE